MSESHDAAERRLVRQAKALKATKAQPAAPPEPGPERNGKVPHDVQAQLAAEAQQPVAEPEAQPEPESKPALQQPAGTRTVPDHHQRSAGPISRPPQPPPPPATWRGWLAETWAWLAVLVVALVVAGLVVLVFVVGPALVWWSRLLEALG